MSSAETLLRQVLANPGDDQPRAVYADLLQSHGDPRGELITIDLALARARRPELVARKAALLAEHGAIWWPIPVERVEVRRGFVERVAGTAKELGAASRMFETEPIDRVELCEAHDFEPAPWQDQVRELAVRGWFGRGIEQLAASTVAPRLEVLDLASTNIDSIQGLGDRFGALHTFSLADNLMLRHDGKLASWAHLPQLRRVDLRRCRLDATLLGPVVAKLSHVEELLLSGNPIGPDGIYSLVRRLAELPSLRRLEVRGTGIGVEGYQALRSTLPRCHIDVEMPARVVLDLVGRELVLESCGGELWQALVDGVPRRVEMAHSVEYDGGRGPTVTHGDSGMKVPLEPLARALANGAARTLERGFVKVERSSSSGAVYNTSVWSRETVKIGFTPTTVEVTFEEYIDTST